MTEQIRIVVSTADFDPDRLELATTNLRTELIDVAEDVTQLDAGPAPDGTRALDAATIGALLVTVGPGMESLHRLVQTVRGWLSRSHGQFTAELVLGDDRLTVTGISGETQLRLIEEWLRARSAADTTGDPKA